VGAAVFNVKQNIVRLNPDVSVDNSFVTGAGFNSASYFPMLPGDGTNDVFFFGTYSSHGSMRTGGLVRLSSSGSL
jgi:hypothetical protein